MTVASNLQPANSSTVLSIIFYMFRSSSSTCNPCPLFTWLTPSAYGVTPSLYGASIALNTTAGTLLITKNDGTVSTISPDGVPDNGYTLASTDVWLPVHVKQQTTGNFYGGLGAVGLTT